MAEIYLDGQALSRHAVEEVAAILIEDGCPPADAHIAALCLVLETAGIEDGEGVIMLDKINKGGHGGTVLGEFVVFRGEPHVHAFSAAPDWPNGEFVRWLAEGQTEKKTPSKSRRLS